MQLIIRIDDKIFPTVFLVSPNVDEVILGRDWMRASHVIWNFQDDGIMLDGQRILLHMKQQKPYCNGCVLRNDTTIQPRSEAILPAHVIYGNLRMQHDEKHWRTIPFESVCGLRVARTLISNECDKAKIRVCNITERPSFSRKVSL